jgi:hypothetical protein
MRRLGGFFEGVHARSDAAQLFAKGVVFLFEGFRFCGESAGADERDDGHDHEGQEQTNNQKRDRFQSESAYALLHRVSGREPNRNMGGRGRARKMAAENGTRGWSGGTNGAEKEQRNGKFEI